jgi:hypothetical protein
VTRLRRRMSRLALKAIGMYLWDLPGVAVESALAVRESTIVVVPPTSGRADERPAMRCE